MSSRLGALVTVCAEQIVTTGPEDRKEEQALQLASRLGEALDKIVNDPTTPAGKLIQDTKAFLAARVRAEVDAAEAAAMERSASRFGVEPETARRARLTVLAEAPVRRGSTLAVWKLDDSGLQAKKVLGQPTVAATALAVTPDVLAGNVLSRANKEYWHYKAAGVTHFAINTEKRSCEPITGDKIPAWADLVVDARNPGRIAFHYFAPTGNVLILANKSVFEATYAPREVMAVAK